MAKAREPKVFRSMDDLPLMLTPYDLMDFLGKGQRQTYELIHSEGFPYVQDGPKIKLTGKSELKIRLSGWHLSRRYFFLSRLSLRSSVTPLTWATWVISYFPSSKPCLWFFLFLVSW